MKIKNKNRLAELTLLAVTVIWGSGFVVVKNATDSVPPGYIVAIRFWMAAIFMSLVFFPRLRRLNRKCLLAGVFNGVLLFLAYYFQTVGVKYTTAGNNAFLTTSYVVIVPFLYWIVKRKRPDIYNVTAAFLCVAGIGFISLKSDFSIGVGDLLTLLCGVSFAAHIVSTAILTQKHDPILLTIMQFFSTAVLATIVAIPTEPFPAGFSAETVMALIYIGVVATFIALMAQSLCQKHMPPAKASLIMSLESVFGCVFGAIFLGDIITLQSAAGFVLVFVAVILSETKLHFLKPHSAKVLSGTPVALVETDKIEEALFDADQIPRQ